LSGVACLSEFHLARMFRTSFGTPPYAWIAAQRVERARLLLRTTALPLEQVAARCGYANASHFSHRFRAAVGVPPLAYRRAMGRFEIGFFSSSRRDREHRPVALGSAALQSSSS
jgi:AraC family transcriptional regulator